MRRSRGFTLGARLCAIATLAGVPSLLTGCRVERTPAELIDHGDPIQDEREVAAGEVQDRILAFGQALGRGSPADAVVALSPAEDVYVLGPQGDLAVVGAQQVGAVIGGFVLTPVAVEFSDVHVEVGPRGNVAWFRAVLQAPGREAGGTKLRITGVYVRDEGSWQLVQAHVSRPFNSAPPSPAVTAADSAAGG